MFDRFKKPKGSDNAPGFAQEAIKTDDAVLTPKAPESLGGAAPLPNPAIPDADSQTGPRRYAIQEGEMFPWKGFMFRVTKVTEDGFACSVCGYTKRLKERVEQMEAAKTEALRRQAIRAKQEAAS